MFTRVAIRSPTDTRSPLRERFFFRQESCFSMDTLSPRQRSERMSLIRPRSTKPEILVRRIVRGCGFTYRLNVGVLPGKPDLVFPAQHKIIFVHGCFWHRHPHCSLARLPKSKLGFWLPKLTQNRQRDLRNVARLRRTKWGVQIIWECQLRDLGRIEKRIRRFLLTRKPN
jgi:DNA mismatch endonuclease (patch repair protein)